MLQFITHRTARYSYLEGATAALNGGCKWIQLRMKGATPDEVKTVVEALKPLCQKHEAILLLDDYVELVTELDVDGVHLGKNDMPVAQARKLLGEKYIIGGTANTYDDVAKLAKAGVDYIGLGPFRYTETKQNLSPILGIEGYRNIVQQCKDSHVDIPIVAIGGIEVDDLAALIDTGIASVAISGAILQAESPEQTTRNIIETLNKLRYGR